MSKGDKAAEKISAVLKMLVTVGPCNRLMLLFISHCVFLQYIHGLMKCQPLILLNTPIKSTCTHTLMRDPSLSWMLWYLDYFITVLQLSHFSHLLTLLSSSPTNNTESEVRKKKKKTNPSANPAFPQETKFPKFPKQMQSVENWN